MSQRSAGPPAGHWLQLHVMSTGRHLRIDVTDSSVGLLSDGHLLDEASWSLDHLRALHRAIDRAHRTGRPAPRARISALWDAIFVGGVRRAYQRVLRESRGRITLYLAVDRALEFMPWELLATARDEPVPRLIVRVARGAEVDARRDAEDTLRVALIAGPPFRALVEELAFDLQALRRDSGEPCFSPQTIVASDWEAALSALEEASPHVVHFVGHGGFLGGASSLWLETDQALRDVALAEALPETVQLVYLQSCEGGRPARRVTARDPLRISPGETSSAAEQLARRADAVIGHLQAIPLPQARALARRFYEELRKERDQGGGWRQQVTWSLFAAEGHARGDGDPGGRRHFPVLYLRRPSPAGVAPRRRLYALYTRRDADAVREHLRYLRAPDLEIVDATAPGEPGQEVLQDPRGRDEKIAVRLRERFARVDEIHIFWSRAARQDPVLRIAIDAVVPKDSVVLHRLDDVPAPPSLTNDPERSVRSFAAGRWNHPALLGLLLGAALAMERSARGERWWPLGLVLAAGLASVIYQRGGSLRRYRIRARIVDAMTWLSTARSAQVLRATERAFDRLYGPALSSQRTLRSAFKLAMLPAAPLGLGVMIQSWRLGLSLTFSVSLGASYTLMTGAIVASVTNWGALRGIRRLLRWGRRRSGWWALLGGIAMGVGLSAAMGFAIVVLSPAVLLYKGAAWTLAEWPLVVLEHLKLQLLGDLRWGPLLISGRLSLLALATGLWAMMAALPGLLYLGLGAVSQFERITGGRVSTLGGKIFRELLDSGDRRWDLLYPVVVASTWGALELGTAASHDTAVQTRWSAARATAGLAPLPDREAPPTWTTSPVGPLQGASLGGGEIELPGGWGARLISDLMTWTPEGDGLLETLREPELRVQRPPARTVDLDRAVCLTTAELTQGWWDTVWEDQRALAMAWGLHRLPSTYAGWSLPVEGVSWCESLRFLNLWSLRDGRAVAYTDPAGDPAIRECEAGAPVRWEPAADGYRLPTEAEWEIAARDLNHLDAPRATWPGGDADDVAWYDENSRFRTHPTPGDVKAANTNGLYHAAGNVSEWVWDCYTASAEPDDACLIPGDDGAIRCDCRGDGDAPPMRALRGGAAAFSDQHARPTFRNAERPQVTSVLIGLRAAMTVGEGGCP